MIENNLLTEKSGNNGDNSIPLDRNEESNDMNFLKLDELILKYPELTQVLGWTKEDLIVFYEGKLLLGRETVEDEKTVLYISEDSLKRLMEYHKSLDDLKTEFENSDA